MAFYKTATKRAWGHDTKSRRICLLIPCVEREVIGSFLSDPRLCCCKARKSISFEFWRHKLRTDIKLPRSLQKKFHRLQDKDGDGLKSQIALADSYAAMCSTAPIKVFSSADSTPVITLATKYYSVRVRKLSFQKWMASWEVVIMWNRGHLNPTCRRADVPTCRLADLHTY